jgi:dCMP deaminase
MLLNSKWQNYFANVALAVARGSLDPSTKVGAIIYRPDKSIVSCGFNGLPRGIPDNLERMIADRQWKYDRIVHAEANALDHKRECTFGYGMVVTHPPCSKCALKIISNGIKTVYTIPASDDLLTRWADEIALSEQLFAESGVKLLRIED